MTLLAVPALEPMMPLAVAYVARRQQLAENEKK